MSEFLSRRLDLSVLVVDDGQNMRRLIRDMLFQIGVTRVRCEASSTDILTLLNQTAPDLLIVSWELGRIPAFDVVCHAVSLSRSLFRPVPVIALIDYATKGAVLRARAAGISSVLQKPISPGALRDRILWVTRHRVSESERHVIG